MDGGGIRGLVQIEILRQIEEATGKRIPELFDWIVGTSTGGIIALARVYGELAEGLVYKLYHFPQIGILRSYIYSHLVGT